jgi:hypothetical protein
LALRQAGAQVIGHYSLVVMFEKESPQVIHLFRCVATANPTAASRGAPGDPHNTATSTNDNHVFTTLSSSGTSQKLITRFFAGGIGLPQLTDALAEARQYRWTED